VYSVLCYLKLCVVLQYNIDYTYFRFTVNSSMHLIRGSRLVSLYLLCCFKFKRWVYNSSFNSTYLNWDSKRQNRFKIFSTFYSHIWPWHENMQGIKGALAFICFSFFFFWLRVLDKADYSAFESTLNSTIVSYRIGWYQPYLRLFGVMSPNNKINPFGIIGTIRGAALHIHVHVILLVTMLWCK